MEIIESLNDKQKEAVLYNEGPLLILAAAGSGKTRVITGKIFYLISEKKVKPSNILALTFTNKAAREMKERLEKFLGSSARYVFTGTFHSFAAKILRIESENTDYKQNFSIYDEYDSISAINKVLKDLNLSNKEYNPKLLYKMFSLYKNSLFQRKIDGDIIKSIYKKYQEFLISHNAMDFDDILINFLKLLEIESIKEKYQEKYKYILVDEYQDTNILQYKIVKILSSKYKFITACGDDDQGIYSFRGATIENILRFENDFPGCKTVILDKNYRSTQTIINAAAYLIQNNKYRKSKIMRAVNLRKENIIINSSNNPDDEAKFVYDTVMDNLFKNGVKYKDIAVLYRNNFLSRNIEEIFRFKGVPYNIKGGYNFYDREEIKDIISYLMVFFNPKDDISLLRIINTPTRGIGINLVRKINEFSKKTGLTIIDILKLAFETKDKFEPFSSKEIIKLSELYKIINNYRDNITKSKNFPDKINEFIREINYKEYLQKHTEANNFEKKWDNVESFINSIYGFKKREPNKNFYEFIEKLIYLKQGMDQDDEEKNSVNLLTIHTAKGLEFKIVIIIGVEEGIIPSSRALVEHQIEEERRLFYVGMTRAKEKLYLSFCENREKYGKKYEVFPSRFLDEIPENLIEYDKSKHENKIEAKDLEMLKNILKK